MSKHGRDNRPYLRPVTRIELSEKNIKLRWILIVVFLAIAVTAIGVGLFSALNTDPGWNVVEVSSDKPNCSSEFQLMYDFSEAGGNATAVNRKLISLYTQATEDGYSIFSPDIAEEGLYNLHYLNRHPNETITVAKPLYDALALVKESGIRNIYLAPVYVEYNRVFRSDSDVEAAQFDPGKNPEVMAYVSEMISFIRNPEKIDIELLGNNSLRLKVSEDYLRYAQENGIETFVDFGWMRNAFAADYIAQILMDQGFTSGYLASYDGFTRNLDARGNTYSFNIFDRKGSDVYLPGVMQYTDPVSIVYLKDYPLDDLDKWNYYVYETGEITTVLIDPADGVSKSSAANLVSYSYDLGCGQTLLQMLPGFVADEFSVDAVNASVEKGIYSIWCQDEQLCYNDTGLLLELQPNADGITYTKNFAG